MKRIIENDLINWKSNLYRKPLIIRGARQIGKTTTIRNFAKQHFDSFVEVNFELNPNLKQIFNTLDVKTIVKNLVLTLGKPIQEGSTLLFFDEIQECPQAISALRYFYETLPKLHVIAAGSLIEFALEAENFKMPVGRVEYLFMQPLTFMEFLQAQNEHELAHYLSELCYTTTINPAVDNRLFHYFRSYTIVGGMPEAVAAYRNNATSVEFQNIQLSILQTYRDDFGKYAEKVKHPYLEKVFSSAPFQVGKIYKYSQVDRDVQSRDLKDALQLLTQARIITKVMDTSGHGLPFLKGVNDKKFKIVFLDVGLMQRAFGLDAKIALEPDFLSIQSGAIAEQFVGQELLAYRNLREDPELFFWSRENKNSQAEVDFLTSIGTHVIPIEVKSGKTGTLKSLQLFLNEYSPPFGVRFSQHPLSFHDKILSIPIYAVSQMKQIAAQFCVANG